MKPRWTATPLDLPGQLVALATVKSHARVYSTDDDGLIADVLIPAAINTVARDTRRIVRPTKYRATLPAGTREVDLPAGPFAGEVTMTVASLDELVVIDSAQVAHDGGEPGCLSLPAVAVPHTSIEIAYRAGLTPLEPEVVLLVCSLVSHWYEHREAATADGTPRETPLGYRHLVAAMDPHIGSVRAVGAAE